MSHHDKFTFRYLVNRAISQGLIRLPVEGCRRSLAGMTPTEKKEHRRTLWRNQKRYLARVAAAKKRNPGIMLKQWVTDQCEREGITRTAITNRLSRGQYPGLKLKRKNKRVIYVLNPNDANWSEKK